MKFTTVVALVISLCLGGLLAGCTSKDTPAVACQVIDMTGDEVDSIPSLAGLIDTLYYRRLHIPSEYQEFSKHPVVRLTNNYILLSLTIFQRGVYCLVYDRHSGEYKGKIEAVFKKRAGQTHFYNLTPDLLIHTYADEDYLYFSGYTKYPGQNKKNYWYKWDLNTLEVKDSFPYLSSPLEHLSLFNKSTIVKHLFNESGHERVHLSFINSKGETEKEILHHQKYVVTRPTYGIDPLEFSAYRKDGAFHYFDSNSDTVFRVSDKYAISPVYYFKQGTRKRPYYFTQRSTPKEIGRASLKYYLIRNVKENSRYLFYECFYKRKMHAYLWDNRTQKLFANASGRIYNDVDGGMPFWPLTITEKDELVSFFFPFKHEQYCIDHPDREIKNPAAHQRLNSLMKDVSENDIIVSIAKFK